MDIQSFIAEFKKTFVYDLLSMTLKDEQLFEHVVDGDSVLWFKEQTRQMWLMWEKAKAPAVPNLGELQERIAGHQYYHDEHGHMIVDMDDVVKEISSFDSCKAQAVPEGFVLVSAEQMSQWGHMASYAEQYGCPECFEARGYAHSLACEINEFFAMEAQEQVG